MLGRNLGIDLTGSSLIVRDVQTLFLFFFFFFFSPSFSALYIFIGFLP